MRKKFLKGASLLLIMMMIVAGCAQNSPLNDEGENQDQASGNESGNEISENELSPVPDEVDSKINEDVTFYYADKDLMNMYRIKVEIEADSKEDLPEVALKTWMKGPEQDDLNNLLPPEVVVEKVEFKDDIAYVSFSQEIRNANLGSSGESYLINQIVLLMQQFGYNATQILVEGEAEESILGHVTTSSPIPATDPEEYEWYN